MELTNRMLGASIATMPTTVAIVARRTRKRRNKQRRAALKKELMRAEAKQTKAEKSL